MSLSRELAQGAKLVIAEISEQMPFTCGDSTIPRECIDFLIEGEVGPVCHASRPPGETERRIVEHLCDLVPSGASVQLGIGAVPDALMRRLAERKDVTIQSGMVADGVIEFVQRTGAKVVTGEVVGSAELFRFVHENPRVEMRAASYTHDVARLGRLDCFVSINSAPK